MQCVNCAFYNVPGSAACGRCGTTLRFDQLDVSVEPPRAGRGTLAARNRLLRLFHRGRAAAGRVREEVGSTVRPYLGERVPPLGLFVRAAVPGWPLRAVGATALGWMVLGAWVLLVLAALVCLGYQASGLFLGLAFAVHYAGALYATRVAGFDRVYTYRVGAVLAVLMLVVVYVPGPILFNTFVQPVTVNRPVGPLNVGDVVVYFPGGDAPPGRLRLGDWVIFETTGGQQSVGQNQNYYVQPGLYLTRVLAVAGDRLVFDGQTLTVSGVPCDWQPPPRRLKKPDERVIPDGRYLVAPWVPDLVPYNNNNERYGPGVVVPQTLDSPALYVDTHQVRGRVAFKLHPLGEMGRLR